jgi:hypothetical protein
MSVLKGFKGVSSCILMPVIATMYNTIDDARCSKCKKMQDMIYFMENDKVYKTCNECRDRARRMRQPRIRITHRDTDDTPSPSALLAMSSAAADVSYENDLANMIATFQAMSLSSSSSAAAVCSSANYFVDEPEAEPEP